MAVGSTAMWILNPLAWLWLASQVQSESHRVGLWPYILLLTGVVATAVVLAVALAQLNRLYGHVTGAPPELRVILPWHRSMRDARHGGRDEPGRPVSVLDVVMVVSVALCAVVFLGWYFITDPTPPGIGGPGGSKD
ncbi:MAG TPA: hypothetical protein VHF90_03185 [Thermoleophilaceae bacterium]|nr:hypothetical protein [Thermoleophilaceae bacterium]